MADYNNDDLDALYRAVGFTVINWGLIEQTIDFCVATIYHTFPEHHNHEPLPKELKREMEFIRRSLNEVPELAEEKEQGIKLLDRLANGKDKRENIVHGAIVTAVAKDGVFKFRRMQTKPNMHHTKETDFDLKKFPDFSRELVDLVSDLTAFSRQLVDKHTE